MKNHKKYKITNMRKFKRFIFLSTMLICILSFSSTKVYSKDIPQYDYINVKEGDTLWSLASNYNNEDIRELVQTIKVENNIKNATIYPGDIIRVPIH